MKEDAAWIYFETSSERQANAPFRSGDQYYHYGKWWCVDQANGYMPIMLPVRRPKPPPAPEYDHFI